MVIVIAIVILIVIVMVVVMVMGGMGMGMVAGCDRSDGNVIEGMLPIRRGL
jgi:hypothetical protein